MGSDDHDEEEDEELEVEKEEEEEGTTGKQKKKYEYDTAIEQRPVEFIAKRKKKDDSYYNKGSEKNVNTKYKAFGESSQGTQHYWLVITFNLPVSHSCICPSWP